jgi:hypothetical protein
MKKAMMVLVVVGMVSLPVLGTEMEPKNLISFTPVAGNASYGISSGWFDKAWAYSTDMALSGNSVVANVNGALGGVVYKFKSTAVQPLDLAIDAAAYFGNWSGRKATLYFSDVNDWSQLSPMTGSTWSGWSAEWETNPNWVQLGSLASWGGPGGWQLISNTTSTTDGEFYVRVDLSGADAPIPSTYLNGLNWTATPEPATMTLLTCGLAGLLRRKK